MRAVLAILITGAAFSLGSYVGTRGTSAYGGQVCNDPTYGGCDSYGYEYVEATRPAWAIPGGIAIATVGLAFGVGILRTGKRLT